MALGRLIAVALAGCAALLAPVTARAAEFTVTTTVDEYGTGAACSLREAVEAANLGGSFGGCSAADSDADIINLPASNYVLTIDGIDDDNEAGDLDVLNEPLAIKGQASSGPSTIDGDADDADGTDDRVIQVHQSVVTDAIGEDFGATGLIIRDGATTGFGGGVSVSGPVDGPPPDTGEEATIGFSLVTFTANTAEVGGALYTESAELTRVVNSTVSGNSARGPGGGIDTSGTTTNPSLVQLENATISNNTADAAPPDGGSGGGISARGTGGTMALYNAIVAGNFDLSSSGPVAPDCTGDGPMTSGGYNLIGNLANCDGLPSGTGDIRDMPAGLAPLALIPGAGLGTVLAHDLTPTSLARDAGNPAPVGGPLGTCEPTAQNFGPRPQGPRCDIGAVEADVIPTGGGGAPATAPVTKPKKKCKKKKKKRSAEIAKKKKKCKKKKKR
jgi:CSLREA domain-containing protein